MTEHLETPPQARRAWRRRLRAVLSGVVSALVLATAALYLLIPTGSDVALSVGEVSGPQAYSYDATPIYVLTADRLTTARLTRDGLTAARRRYTETFYGAVSGKVHVRHPVLRIVGAGPAVRGQRVRIPLRASGAYRATLHLRPGRYRVTIVLVAGGKTRTDSTALRLRSGRSYRASATVTVHGGLTMLPVSGY